MAQMPFFFHKSDFVKQVFTGNYGKLIDYPQREKVRKKKKDFCNCCIRGQSIILNEQSVILEKKIDEKVDFSSNEYLIDDGVSQRVNYMISHLCFNSSFLTEKGIEATQASQSVKQMNLSKP